MLPVAVIGAGPVGLAAAAHLVRRGLRPLLLERGPTVGATVAAWGHVRVFSPWSFNIDAAARALLEAAAWTAPDEDALPTGHEIIRDYLRQLAAHPAIAPHLVLGAEVVAIERQGATQAAPLTVRWRDITGAAHERPVRAVIDASGTWLAPNPMGVDGRPVPGERDARDAIDYGIPDVLGRAREAHAGKRVLVVGGGHSAINVLLDLLRLQESAPATRPLWALRNPDLTRLLGGGLNDRLPARGELGLAAERALGTGRLQMLAPFAALEITRREGGLLIHSRHDGRPARIEVDRIVVATGFRPQLDMLRGLRLALDAKLEAPVALAPLIDPALHSCGTVPPHGAVELAHPETGFFIVGAKSYGRAPTFLMATGYEQVRSVVAEIAGDHAAARRVELVLPETGVCSVGGRAAVAAADVGARAACCGRAA